MLAQPTEFPMDLTKLTLKSDQDGLKDHRPPAGYVYARVGADGEIYLTQPGVEDRTYAYRIIDPKKQLTLSLTGTDNADGTGTLAVQVVDLAGNSVAGYFQFSFRTSATAYGAAADLGDFAATAGQILIEHTTDALGVVETNSSGAATLTITPTTDDEVFIQAELNGEVVATSIDITTA